MKIFIGTNNKNKIEQFTFIFKKYAPEIELVFLADLKITEDVEEDADNLLDNAKKKAQFYGEKSGLMTIADDTGLFVDALGGEPGVHAKRWHAGSEHDRCVKLNERLVDVPALERTARYTGVLASYNPLTMESWQFEASCEGLITDYYRGDNGFGYDQIFKVISLDKQYAELTREEEMAAGHRARGVKEFVNKISL